MIRVVGAKGYGETTVVDVIEEAGTSHTTFYKYFEDKHHCFLAAYEMLVEQVFDEVIANCDRRASWLARMTDGLATIVDRFALDPALARTAVVEVAAAGADARRLHRDAVARFTEYLDAGREEAADKELPENISLMSAGAVSGLIFDELVAGRAEQLSERLPDLLFAMLVPFVGPQAAAAQMRRVAGGH
jgi:AcrR family transcriptional regulator